MLRIILSTILALNIILGYLPGINLLFLKGLELKTESLELTHSETCSNACCTDKTKESCCCNHKKAKLTDISQLPNFSDNLVTKEKIKYYNNTLANKLSFNQENLDSSCSCPEQSLTLITSSAVLPLRSVSLTFPKVLILVEEIYFNSQLTNQPYQPLLRSPPSC